MEHVICHLKPSLDATPLAYSLDMSGFDDIDEAEGTFESADPPPRACQWCCHEYSTPSIGIPSKRAPDGTYVVSGQFCSHSCAAASIFDQHVDNNTAWTRYQLLNDMVGGPAPVVRAPPRIALAMFGGSMSIEDFRKGGTTVVARQPPTIVESIRMEEIPSGHLYRDLYKPLDEERVNDIKVRLHRKKPKNSFYMPLLADNSSSTSSNV
jgi:hypothetical protein